MTNKEAITILEDKQAKFSEEYIDYGGVNEAYKMAIQALEQMDVLDKISAEIMDCLNALDEIEKTGVNIYLPNEISGRRLTYQQCLKFIDKYKIESEDKK